MTNKKENTKKGVRTLTPTRMGYLIALLVTVLMTGCGTKRTVTDADFARQLSHELNMRLTPKDNLLLYAFVNEWMGVPYKYGGTGKRGVDCSGFVRYVHRKTYGHLLSRSTEDMYKDDCRKIKKRQLREGDLIFFATDNSRRKRVNHVGIYLKSGYFSHASTSSGVMISHLDEDYFRKRFVSGGRVK